MKFSQLKKIKKHIICLPTGQAGLFTDNNFEFLIPLKR